MRKNMVDPVLAPFKAVCALEADACGNSTLRLRHEINPKFKDSF